MGTDDSMMQLHIVALEGALAYKWQELEKKTHLPKESRRTNILLVINFDDKLN